MSNALWPTSLPQDPLIAGLTEDPGTVTIRTAMATGPAKLRPRQSVPVGKWPVGLKLDAAQVTTLLDFYQDTLGHGSLPFDWHNPRTNSVATLRFLEAPKISHDTPRLAGNAGRYTARFMVETVPTTQAGGLIQPTIYKVRGKDQATFHEYSENSQVLLRMRSTCQNVTFNGLQGEVYRTALFVQATGADPENDAATVEWAYTDAGGTTTVVFTKDAGWTIAVDADHPITPSCPGATPVIPGTHSESGTPLLVLDYATAAIQGNGDEQDLCSGANPYTADWFMLLEASVLAVDHTPPTGEGLGFRVYAAACSTPPYTILDGAIGTVTIWHDSAIDATLQVGCLNDAVPAFINKASDTMTLDYSHTILDGSSVPESVVWAYSDVNGDSYVLLHRDDGWSFGIDADHNPEPTSACGGYTQSEPTQGFELADGDLFRTYQWPAITGSGGDEDALCGPGVATDAWMLLLDAALDPGSGSLDDAARNTGFRRYNAVCDFGGAPAPYIKDWAAWDDAPPGSGS